MNYEIITKSPDQLSEIELGDFTSLILASGEVARNGLENRVRKAERLIILRVAACLAGIGALKRPNASYRNRVGSASGIRLPSNEYPVELGWIFVLPSYRGKRYAHRITEEAVSVAKGVGIFATSRGDNFAMHKALERQGFVHRGRPYRSKHGNHDLLLFLRSLLQQNAMQ